MSSVSVKGKHGSYSYDNSNPLGRGGNSEVFEVIESENKAIKLFVCEDIKKEQERKNRFLYEIDILKKYSSRMKHMIKFFDDGEDDNDPFYIMKKLETYVDIKKENLRVREKIQLSIQLVEAVKELHSVGIVHRDIKPSNLLFDNDCNGLQLVLSDYGLAYSDDRGFGFETLPYEKLGSFDFRPIELSSNKNDMTATDYMYSDIYQCVKTIYCLFNGSERPFPDSVSHIGKEFEIERYNNKPFIEIIYKMIDEGIKGYYKDRLSLDDCLQYLRDAENIISSNSYSSEFEYKRWIRRQFYLCSLTQKFIIENKKEINNKYEELLQLECVFKNDDYLNCTLTYIKSLNDYYEAILNIEGASYRINYCVEKMIITNNRVEILIRELGKEAPYNTLLFFSTFEKGTERDGLVLERKISSFSPKDINRNNSQSSKS